MVVITLGGNYKCNYKCNYKLKFAQPCVHDFFSHARGVNNYLVFTCARFGFGFGFGFGVCLSPVRTLSNTVIRVVPFLTRTNVTASSTTYTYQNLAGTARPRMEDGASAESSASSIGRGSCPRAA
jgi:hypothetical protein